MKELDGGGSIQVNAPGSGGGEGESSQSPRLLQKTRPAAPHKKAMITKQDISDFEIWRKVGEGSFGTVVLARRHWAWYALKIIRKKSMKNGDAKRICTEARALRYLRHPFIVCLKFAFQDINHVYLGLEPMEGGDLRDALERHGPLSVRECALYVGEIALALEHIHTSQFVYRDLKPSNILIDARGHLALGDFGLAKSLVAEKGEEHNLTTTTRARTFCGTPAYMAPEYFLSRESKGYGTEVDWYALGIVLTQCLTGKDKLLDEVFDTMDYDGMAESFRNGSHLKPFSQDTPAEAADLRNRLCCVAVSARLKGGPELKRHPFFGSIDWRALLRKEHSAPLAISHRVSAQGSINAFSLYGTDAIETSCRGKATGHFINYGVLTKELEQLDHEFLSSHDSLLDEDDFLDSTQSKKDKVCDHSIIKHFDTNLLNRNTATAPGGENDTCIDKDNQIQTALGNTRDKEKSRCEVTPSCRTFRSQENIRILSKKKVEDDSAIHQGHWQSSHLRNRNLLKRLDAESQPSRCVVSPEEDQTYRSEEEKKSEAHADDSFTQQTFLQNERIFNGTGSTRLERSVIVPTAEYSSLRSQPATTFTQHEYDDEPNPSLIATHQSIHSPPCYPPAASPLTCPITCDVFLDPVITEDGYTYERAALSEHIQKYGPYSPCTGNAINIATIFSNIALRRLCVVSDNSTGTSHHDDDDTSTVAADDDKNYSTLHNNRHRLSSSVAALSSLSSTSSSQYPP